MPVGVPLTSTPDNGSNCRGDIGFPVYCSCLVSKLRLRACSLHFCALAGSHAALLCIDWLGIGRGWLVIGWVLAGYWLGIGWLLAGYWLGIGWLLAGYWPRLAGYWLVIGWLLAGYWLVFGWLLAGYWLVVGW